MDWCHQLVHIYTKIMYKFFYLDTFCIRIYIDFLECSGLNKTASLHTSLYGCMNIEYCRDGRKKSFYTNFLKDMWLIWLECWHHHEILCFILLSKWMTKKNNGMWRGVIYYNKIQYVTHFLSYCAKYFILVFMSYVVFLFLIKGLVWKIYVKRVFIMMVLNA